MRQGNGQKSKVTKIGHASEGTVRRMRTDARRAFMRGKEIAPKAKYNPETLVFFDISLTVAARGRDINVLEEERAVEWASRYVARQGT